MGVFLPKRWLEPAMLEPVQRIKPLAADAGLTLAQFALAWVLREPNAAAAIIGATRSEQVDENCAASGARVPPDPFGIDRLAAPPTGHRRLPSLDGLLRSAKREAPAPDQGRIIDGPVGPRYFALENLWRRSALPYKAWCLHHRGGGRFL
jgi:hypothetical protein